MRRFRCVAPILGRVGGPTDGCERDVRTLGRVRRAGSLGDHGRRAVALVIVGATWGCGRVRQPRVGRLPGSDSESGQTRAQITAAFGPQDADVFVLYRSASTLGDRPRVPRSGRHRAGGRPCAARGRVASSTDYTTPVPALVSADGHETYAIVKLRAGTDDQKLADYRAVKSAFVAAPACGDAPSSAAFAPSTTTPTCGPSPTSSGPNCCRCRSC